MVFIEFVRDEKFFSLEVVTVYITFITPLTLDLFPSTVLYLIVCENSFVKFSRRRELELTRILTVCLEKFLRSGSRWRHLSLRYLDHKTDPKT